MRSVRRNSRGVVDRIKAAISHYGLTPDQLGFGKLAMKARRGAKTLPSSRNNGRRDLGFRMTKVKYGPGAVRAHTGCARPSPKAIRWSNSAPTHKNARPKQPRRLNKAMLSPQLRRRASDERGEARQGQPQKAAVAAKPARSTGSVVPTDVGTSSASTSKAKRQVKASPTKLERAKKAPAAKASTVAVKSAPQAKAKRRSPSSTAAAKVAAPPGETLL
jgi:hypothetical protein